MTTILKAGADAGNNALKLWVKGQQPILIPTIYSLYMGETTAVIDEDDIAITALEKNIDVTINSPALAQNGKRYIIGEKVIEDRVKGTELEKNSDKSTDELPVMITLAGLAVNAMQMNPIANKIDVSYDLSVALPVQTITPQNAQANAQRYMGTHTVIYHHPSGRNVTVNIKIEYCKCLPEGGAAAWGIVYNEHGKVTKREVETTQGIQETDYVDKTLLSFDIGAGTTEIVVSQGVRFNPKLSEGLHYGVKETILEVIKRWNRNNPRKTIENITEFNEIYLDTEHPRHGLLREASKVAFSQLATRISTAIMDKIDDMKDDPFVFIYGGGAAILKDSLQQILSEKGRLTNVTFLNDEIFVNARGLLVYTCSPRFELQKQKELGVASDAS